MNAPHNNDAFTQPWLFGWRRLLLAAALSLFLLPEPCAGQGFGTSDDTFRLRCAEFFKANDHDGDGFLIGEEIPGEIRLLLAQSGAPANVKLNFQQFFKYREAAYHLQVAIFFKQRDKDEDGWLEKHEMPLQLLKRLGQYTRGGDRVNFQQFLQFSYDRDFPPMPQPLDHAKMLAGMGMGSSPTHIIQIEEPDATRPSMHRSDKLPGDIPNWFSKLDADDDGQISVYEWRRAAKPLEEFAMWDRDGDLLITFDEVVQRLREEKAPRPKRKKVYSIEPTEDDEE